MIKRFIIFVLIQILKTLESIYYYLKREQQYRNLKTCGQNVFISRGCYLAGNLFLGEDIYIGQNCRFQSTKGKIFIGDHVMFGPDVSIHSGNHRIDILGKWMKEITFDEKRPEDDKDVIIEDDVWVGASAIILQGVTIGEGSVIGAGAVITKSVPLSWSSLTVQFFDKFKFIVLSTPG